MIADTILTYSRQEAEWAERIAQNARRLEALTRPKVTFLLGNLTLSGYVLFETPTETCYMLVGEWGTVRVPKQ